MNDAFIFILGLVVGYGIGWFASGVNWMKTIYEDERQKHPERFK